MRHLPGRAALFALLGLSLAACSTGPLFGGKAAPAADTAKATPAATTATPAAAAATGQMAASMPAMRTPAMVTADLEHAQAQRAAGDTEGAIRTLAQLMIFSPDDPRIVGEYGKALVQQGRSGDAIEFLKRATELNANEWSFYSALGVAYDQQHDYANAKLAYMRALQLKPGEAAVLNNYAMSRMRAGDIAAARSLIAQAQARDPANAEIVANAAKIGAMKAAPAKRMAVATPPGAMTMKPIKDKPVPAASSHSANGAPHTLASSAATPAKKPVDDSAPALRSAAD